LTIKPLGGVSAVPDSLQCGASCRYICSPDLGNEAGNRTAVPSDDDLFSTLDTIKQRAESILCLECADRLHIS
jgi:hypothetical protein